MRIQRLKSVAFMAVLLLLFGVSIASAADRDERLFSREPGKTPHMHSLNVGKRNGKPGDIRYFLKSLGSSDCQSGCCWASAQCDGAAHTYCDSSGCDAWCDDGTSASYSCNAT